MGDGHVLMLREECDLLAKFSRVRSRFLASSRKEVELKLKRRDRRQKERESATNSERKQKKKTVRMQQIARESK